MSDNKSLINFPNLDNELNKHIIQMSCGVEHIVMLDIENQI